MKTDAERMIYGGSWGLRALKLAHDACGLDRTPANCGRFLGLRLSRRCA
jgi:hypothetical protein